jgi:ribosomal protein S8
MNKMRDERLLNFGPWINPVEKISDLPLNYQHVYQDSENFEYLLEIPANINKMNITKETELYKNVIGVYPDHIYLISQENNMYTDEKIYFKDVLYIKHSISLLKAEFILHTKEKSIDIMYNAISNEEMKKIEDIIRAKYISYEDMKDMKPIKENLEFPVLETYQQVVVDKLRAKEDHLSFIANQSIMEMDKDNKMAPSGLMDFVHGLHKTYLLGCLCMHNGKELIIVGRDKHFKEVPGVNYSSSIIYIPMTKVESIKEVHSLDFKNLKEINVSLIDSNVNIVFDEKNDTKDFFMELL